MKILVIDNNTKYKEELKSFLGGLGEVEILEKDKLENDFDFSSYGLVVLSGGNNTPIVLRHKEYYKKETELVLNIQKPILGICLGAEIIVYAFLGELYEIDSEIKGEKVIDVMDENLANYLGSNKLSVFEGHHIGIKKEPKDFDILAKSEYGPEILKHRSRPIMALQFHPEKIINNNLKKWILNNLGL